MKIALAAAALAALASPAFAQSQARAAVAPDGAIVVSCYRGPWRDVIVDRPNPVFMESLVARGFSYREAHAIGVRICTDERFVGNMEASREHVLRALREGVRG